MFATLVTLGALSAIDAITGAAAYTYHCSGDGHQPVTASCSAGNLKPSANIDDFWNAAASFPTPLNQADAARKGFVLPSDDFWQGLTIGSGVFKVAGKEITFYDGLSLKGIIAQIFLANDNEGNKVMHVVSWQPVNSQADSNCACGP